MSDERRRFPRIAVESTDLKLVASHTNQQKVRIERIVDFSLGGVQVVLAAGEPMPKAGGLLDVDLVWDGGQQRFDASVRHVEAGDGGSHRVGIEFDDPGLVEKLLGDWYRRAAG